MIRIQIWNPPLVCVSFQMVVITMFIYQKEIKINNTLFLPNQQITK